MWGEQLEDEEEDEIEDSDHEQDALAACTSLPKTDALYLSGDELIFYREFGIPLNERGLKAVFSLVPAVCLYSTKPRTYCHVFVNFFGPFQYPFNSKFFGMKYLPPKRR
eukprot:TRINITY_DN25007_c0_g1_i1.p1 TRINITY_DN25007_c0_g1~~TRINITY_DN25007_c0_g1_i1.p1  ORF type:complete len:109 (-),score=10.32 TRINITY_DN25007_c0_g1_i1:17-343(-)